LELFFVGIIEEMGLVADSINEMQRLCETYWSTIHQLASNKRLLEVSLSLLRATTAGERGIAMSACKLFELRLLVWYLSCKSMLVLKVLYIFIALY